MTINSCAFAFCLEGSVLLPFLMFVPHCISLVLCLASTIQFVPEALRREREEKLHFHSVLCPVDPTESSARKHVQCQS